MLRRLVARAIPRLSTERLIEAIGNLELRDGLEWLREESLVEADRFLAGVEAREDFELAVAGAAMPWVLARGYVSGRHPRITAWIDGFALRHPLVCLASWAGAGSVVRRLVRRGPQRQDCVPGRPPDVLAALLEACGRGEGRPVGLMMSRDVDRRTMQVLGSVVEDLVAAGFGLVWLRVTSGGGLRVTREGTVTHIDVADGVIRAAGEQAGLDGVGRSAAARAAGGRLDRIMAERFRQVLPEWAAGRSLGRALLGARPLAFLLVLGEKYPFVRAVVSEANRREVPTFTYFPSIELGAPSIYRYAARTVFVPNEWTARRLAELGFDRRRLRPVGANEVDGVLEYAGPVGASGPGTGRLLFLTKWPDCAIRNRPILEAVLDECRADGRKVETIVKPHPKDLVSYDRYRSASLRIDREGYESHLHWCDLVVTGMSNSVFHAMALGKPVLVVNTNERIDLGQRHLFERADLPPQVRYAETIDGVRGEVRSLLDAASARYSLSPALVRDFFHALDGRTSARITEAVLDGTGRRVGADAHG